MGKLTGGAREMDGARRQDEIRRQDQANAVQRAAREDTLRRAADDRRAFDERKRQDEVSAARRASDEKRRQDSVQVKEKGHNIPHYANVSRVSDTGYKVQPFAEKQTIFHMPPKKTQASRIEEFRRDGVKNVMPPYNTSRPVYDGLAKSASYERRASADNMVGSWVGVKVNKDNMAIPGSDARKFVVDVSVHHHAPIRLSTAAPNKYGSGQGEQIEIRGNPPEEYATFKKR